VALFTQDHAKNQSDLRRNSEGAIMLCPLGHSSSMFSNWTFLLLIVIGVFFGGFRAEAADLIVTCDVKETEADSATQTSFKLRFEFFFEVNRYRSAVNRGSGWGAISSPQDFVRADDDRIVLMNTVTEVVLLIPKLIDELEHIHLFGTAILMAPLLEHSTVTALRLEARAASSRVATNWVSSI
jgi:hypothetical protein